MFSKCTQMSDTEMLKAQWASVFFFFWAKLSPFAPLRQCNIVFVQRCIKGSIDKNVKSEQIQLASLWELPLRKKLERGLLQSLGWVL